MCDFLFSVAILDTTGRKLGTKKKSTMINFIRCRRVCHEHDSDLPLSFATIAHEPPTIWGGRGTGIKKVRNDAQTHKENQSGGMQRDHFYNSSSFKSHVVWRVHSVDACKMVANCVLGSMSSPTFLIVSGRGPAPRFPRRTSPRGAESEGQTVLAKKDPRRAPWGMAIPGRP